MFALNSSTNPFAVIYIAFEKFRRNAINVDVLFLFYNDIVVGPEEINYIECRSLSAVFRGNFPDE